MAKRNRWILGGALPAVFFGGLALVFLRPKPAPPLWDLPDFRFPGATSRGPEEVSKSALAGKVWIADFIFIHCAGPCPLLTRKFAQWQINFPKDLRFVSFTVDPARDGVAQLQAYAARQRAEANRWFFATGDKDDLAQLFIQGFKLPIQYDPLAPSESRVAHSTRFVLVDKRGRVRGFFDYNDPDLDRKMRRAVEALLKE